MKNLPLLLLIIFFGCSSNVPCYSVEQYVDGFAIEHSEIGELWITKHPIEVKGDSLFIPPEVEIFGKDSDIRLVFFDPKKHKNIWGPKTSIDFIILEPDTLSFALEMNGDILGDIMLVGWAERGRYSIRFRLNEEYPAGKCLFLITVGEELKSVKKTYLK